MAMTYDVAVIGGGVAGLTAGLRAAEHGARVIVLEASDSFGGQARVAAGVFAGARDVDRLHAYIPDGDAALQRLICDDYDAAIGWLESHGLPVGAPVALGDFRVHRRMLLGEPGARGPFLDLLTERVASRGVTLRRGLRVRALRRDGDGYRVGDDLEASAVVLATGGFAASRELRERHLGPAARALRLRALPGANGDGLHMALALGGSCAGDMTAFYGHTMADCALEPEQWQPLTPYFAREGVLINQHGQRFVDESASLLEEANPQAGYRQPGGVYWLLFDRAALTTDTGTEPASEWVKRARAVGAPLVETATHRELLTWLAREGVQTAEVQRLRQPPFYGLRCVAGITASCGGIAIDDRCRVLDGRARPVPGLFAVGVDAGGVFGATYGGFLAWALISGRRAGDQAATGALQARIVSALEAAPRRALFVTELAARIRPVAEDALDAGLRALEHDGRAIVVDHPSPDVHLEDADLRVVAVGDRVAADAVWTGWLRSFLATHRCG